MRQGSVNAHLDGAGVARYCVPSPAAHALLDRAVARLGLSARGYHRVARVARTIADLAASDPILPDHMAEAIGLRGALELPTRHGDARVEGRVSGARGGRDRPSPVDDLSTADAPRRA